MEPTNNETARPWACGDCCKRAGRTEEYPPHVDALCGLCGRALLPLERIAAALAVLARAGLGPGSGSAANNDKETDPETVDVDGAARLLKTTAVGVYSLKAKGKMPKPIGRGRRLLWRRDDLLGSDPRVGLPRSNRR
jgi:hypothetical protein